MQSVQLGSIDYAILIIYVAFVVGIGFALTRYLKTSSDFLTSGRSMPAWVTGLAFISANLGALELIGMMANGAQYGIPTVHYYWIGAVPAMVFLAKRFNRTTQRIQGVIFAVASVLIAGVNLFALGLILEALLGWPLQVAI